MMFIKFDGQKRGITNNTCKGECSRCGECCGMFIPFTKKEVEVVRQYVKEHNIKPIDRNTPEGFKAHCCFMDEKSHKCLIYEVRPYVCRDFICSRKNWEEKRESYEKYGDYNGSYEKARTIASFDDLIYKDYGPILTYLLSMLNSAKHGNVESQDIVRVLMMSNRLDLLHYLSGIDDKGNKISGEEMLRQYEQGIR